MTQSVDSTDFGHAFPPFIGATRTFRFLDFDPFPQVTLQGSHSLHKEILQFTAVTVNISLYHMHTDLSLTNNVKLKFFISYACKLTNQFISLKDHVDRFFNATFIS